jgi:hypothetical protein
MAMSGHLLSAYADWSGSCSYGSSSSSEKLEAFQNHKLELEYHVQYAEYAEYVQYTKYKKYDEYDEYA